MTKRQAVALVALGAVDAVVFLWLITPFLVGLAVGVMAVWLGLQTDLHTDK